MIDSVTRITLNLQEANTMVSVKAKRRDTGRKLMIHLSDGSLPYRISDDCYAVLTAKKPDGTKINHPCTIDGNVIVYEFQEQTCSTPGKMTAEVTLYGADNKILTSANFVLQVHDKVYNEGDVESADEMDTLDALILSTNALKLEVEKKLANGDFVGEQGPQGPPAPESYGNTPFKIIDLPQTERQCVYYEDGHTVEVTGSAVSKCPRYLGWNLENESRIYLYVGDIVNGDFVPDRNYTIYAASNGAINLLNPSHNRFVVTNGNKWFWYRIEKNEGVTIVGGDDFPQRDSLPAVVPDFISNAGTHYETGDYYSVVLPTDADYAVFVNDAGANGINTMNVSYESDGEPVVSKGVSFGHIPKDAGAALLRIPNSCPLDALRIYSSKPVQGNAKIGKGRLAQEIGTQLIQDFSFESRRSIIWNDSIRAMGEGRRFYGIPYSSRWRNSHYVGFEISFETLANALNDPLSIAYDGGAKTAVKDQTTGKITVTEWWEKVSCKSEVSSTGGPGYGLTCSAFACLISGNPYPQTNRGFTFDRNFAITPAIDTTPGKVMSNAGLTHCVYIDEVYDSGYALLEATDPCVAKTMHTVTLASTGYLGSKTKENTLDKYPYSVANIDSSWYGGQLLNFDFEVVGGPVRPWRGHKAVYGPYDKLANGGSGIGVTIHDNATKVRLIHSETGTVKEGTVVAGTQYLDIEDYVTKNGTYIVDAGDGTVAEQFRFFEHEEVSLSFDASGRAVFSHDDVDYVYARVTGYGGDFAAHMDTTGDSTNGEPIVIAAGQLYPDLAADVNRINKLYAAIVTDDTLDDEGNPDCWGRYSVPCSQFVESRYIPDTGGNVDFNTDETLTLKDGILSVNTTNDMEQDNTLPITSAGVFATVGNIEALLKTI